MGVQSGAIISRLMAKVEARCQVFLEYLRRTQWKQRNRLITPTPRFIVALFEEMCFLNRKFV